MEITLEMVLNILSTSIYLKPKASDGEILTRLKIDYPELNENNFINYSGSILISILENLVQNGNVKKEEGIPAKYSITLKGRELNNSYNSMISDGIGNFKDKEIIEKAEWFIETQGKSNISWLVYSHFKIVRDNNNRADNIASQMEHTDKYTIYFLPNDPLSILVKRNPNFGLNENIKETNVSVQNLNNKLVTFNKLTILIAAFTGIFIASSFFKDDAPNLEPTNKLLEKMLLSQDSIKQYQKGIDSSLQIMARKDSSKTH